MARIARRRSTRKMQSCIDASLPFSSDFAFIYLFWRSSLGHQSKSMVNSILGIINLSSSGWKFSNFFFSSKLCGCTLTTTTANCQSLETVWVINSLCYCYCGYFCLHSLPVLIRTRIITLHRQGWLTRASQPYDERAKPTSDNVVTSLIMLRCWYSPSPYCS